MNKKIVIGSIIVFFIDLISKIRINSFLPFDKVITIIPGFFKLEKVYNTGISFGMLQDSQVLIILLSIVIFVFLLFMQKSFKLNVRNCIAFSLLYGGIVGNLFDRLIYQHVIDFLSFKFGSYSFPVFNIADTCICIGMFLLIIAIILKEDSKKEDSK